MYAATFGLPNSCGNPCAGPNSPTHSEMLKVMLPSTNVTDTAAAETDLNQQLTTLQTQLRAAAGNGSELLLANGLWVAKSLGIKSAFQAGFADSLMHTFQASDPQAGIEHLTCNT